MAEMSMANCALREHGKDNSLPALEATSDVQTSLRLLEITSSGMTHSWGANPIPKSSMFSFIPVGYVIGEVMRLFQWVMPWHYKLTKIYPSGSGIDTGTGKPDSLSPVVNFSLLDERKWYPGLNFGEIEIDWRGRGSGVITARIFDEDGEVQLHHRELLSNLDATSETKTVDIDCNASPNSECIVECAPAQTPTSPLLSRVVRAVVLTALVAIVLAIARWSFVFLFQCASWIFKVCMGLATPRKVKSN
jgi:hypothetical protein